MFFRSNPENLGRYFGPSPPESLEFQSLLPLLLSPPLLYSFLAPEVKLWFMVITPSSFFLATLGPDRLLSPETPSPDPKEPSPLGP